MEIRPCGPSDLKTLQAMARRTYSDAFAPHNTPEDMRLYLDSAFSDERLSRELANPESAFFFILVDGKPAGYMKLNLGEAQTELRDPAALELERIYVEAGHQGRGLGEALVLRAVQEARARRKAFVWLGVWERNHGAIRFYHRMGFRKFAEHDFILGTDRQTDHMMRRDVES